MGQTIGTLLPVAVGVAISPIPIVAVILMLITPRARANGIGFLLGWLIGLAVAVTLAALLTDGTTGAADDASTVAGIVQLVLGALLVLLAVRKWQGRPAPGEPAPTPAWMRAVEGFTAARATALGAFFSGLNPKNTALALSAGATIGAAGLGAGNAVLVGGIFCAVASAGVAAPLIVYLVRGSEAETMLQSWKDWLVEHNGAVMAVLFAVLGAKLLGAGLGALL